MQESMTSVMSVYPLNVVVSDDVDFATAYNADPESAYLMSECLLPAQAQNLLLTGQCLEQLVLLNDSAAMLAECLHQAHWDEWTQPVIHTLISTEKIPAVIAKVHVSLQNKCHEMG